jgi:quercetin dioxygenase-like cupin family protein
MDHTILRRANEHPTVPAAWGGLTWYANRALGNSDALTLGQCVIRPGCHNPLHSHPNCSELLLVVQGRIAHAIEGGATIEMGPGDVMAIPPHVPHNAHNIGETDAILIVVFTSADRETKGEDRP